ncbi:inositol monophosphatase family protein [Tautonia rosea]|uniref:inositol monophosphatase family protein n=1 Tax=Tautonia rosea TaxID=2728037 RepID=UPI001472ED5C|nr:inositol monophosphatase family protein [Tautonia rosea]
MTALDSTIDPKNHPDLALALALAAAATETILPFFRRCAVEWKPDGTEVTAADRAAEERIRDLLRQERSDDGILGEEFGEQPARNGSNRQWIIDPIDGTAAFALGLPMFGTLVALVEGDEPVIGVIHQPATGETTFAAKGAGCWWRPSPDEPPERVTVAPPVPLSEAYASTTGPHSSDIQATVGQIPFRLTHLIRSARRFRFVGDCIQHALVCRGRLHIAWDSLMSPWDIAALVPCVEEAGGVISALDGSRNRILSGRSLLSTCDRSLHEEVLRVLAPEQEG